MSMAYMLTKELATTRRTLSWIILWRILNCPITTTRRLLRPEKAGYQGLSVFGAEGTRQGRSAGQAKKEDKTVTLDQIKRNTERGLITISRADGYLGNKIPSPSACHAG